MKKFIFISVICLLLISCDRQHTERVYYPTGELQMEMAKKGDVLNGRFVSYFKNGKKEMEVNYVNGVVEGVYNRYMFKGTIQERGQYIQGVREGIFKYYDENENLTKEVNYKNDTLNGETIEYFSTGEVQVMGNYKNGEYDGIWSYWDVDNTKIGIAEFKQGSGVFRNYYSNGVLAVECQYENSKRNGYEKFYNEQGVLYREKTFQNDVLVKDVKFNQ